MAIVHISEVIEVWLLKARRGSRRTAVLFTSTSALDGGGWSTPRPGRFTPGKDPLRIVQEAGLAPGPVWRDGENLASTGIWSPDCSVGISYFSVALRPNAGHGLLILEVF
jgi:hypothetical protein